MEQPAFHQPAKALSMVQLGRRVLLVLGLTCLIVVALWLWLSWNGIKKQQLQRMGVAAALISGHAQNYFEYIGSYLESLSDQLRSVDVLQHPARGMAVLQRFKARHPDLGGATVILPDGQILLSTAGKPGAPLPNILSDPEWREDFEHNLQAHGVSVNRPQFGYLLKKWIIPLRYTVRDEHGKVQFLVQTSIPLDRQQSLWSNLGLQPGVVLGLLREDGHLISRLPDEDARKIYGKKVNDPLFKAARKNAGAGFYDDAIGNDVDRVGAYQHLQHFPLYAFVSVPQAVIWRLWWQLVQLPLFLVLGSLITGILVFNFNARRFAARMQIIRRRLDSVDNDVQAPLPSSGVGEIDALCGALADTRDRLKQSAQNREKQLVSAAEAGTYAVRLRDGIVMAADDVFLNMLGRTAGSVIGHSWNTLLADITSGDGNATGEHLSQEMSRRVLRFRHKDGSTVWLALAEYLDQSDVESLRQGLAIDVSQREKLLATVQNQSDRMRALWQLATDRSMLDIEKVRRMLRLGLDTLDMEIALIGEVVDEKYTIRYVEDPQRLFVPGQEMPLSETLCMYSLQDKRSMFLDGRALHERFSDHFAVADIGIQAYASAPVWVGEQIYGTLVFLQRNPRAHSFSDDDKTFVELLASWFGQALQEQKQRLVLETMAMTDSLTQLSNRRAAELRFAEEIARARREQGIFAIAICDLDRFKLINDHFGHDVGDDVLQHIANILRRALREGDWVARWGGEEFIIFLHQSDSASAFQAMERLREQIKAQPLTTVHGILTMTASFGVAVFSGGVQDIPQILAEADGCLYEAKRKGRDCVVMSETARRGTLWKAGMLQHALQENRLVAAYQVMVDLATNEVVADEALARLIHPDGRVVPAGEFVEAAEGINLIHTVDDIVARRAMSRCAVNVKSGAFNPCFAHFVNLSPQFLARKELVDALIEDARNFCVACNVNFGSVKPIVFEITERQLLDDFSRLRHDVQPLLDFGFRLALDDFGSGYSSFLYLAELPVSFLKIEGWMVQNMRNNDKILHMVQSIVALTHKLGIISIAENVEDRETADMLREMGVNWGQGYYFGYPVIDAAEDVSRGVS